MAFSRVIRLANTIRDARVAELVRRGGLKIPCPFKGRAGSSPAPGIGRYLGWPNAGAAVSGRCPSTRHEEEHGHERPAAGHPQSPRSVGSHDEKPSRESPRRAYSPQIPHFCCELDHSCAPNLRISPSSSGAWQTSPKMSRFLAAQRQKSGTFFRVGISSARSGGSPKANTD